MTAPALTHAREVHRAAYDAAKGILDTADAAHRGLTSAEQTRFDQLNRDIELAKDKVDELTERARTDAEADRLLAPIFGNRANNPFGERDGVNGHPARRDGLAAFLIEQRSTGYGNASALLPTNYFGQWFDKLRTASVVLSAGPQLIPVDGHSLILPVLTTSASVSAFAENVAITPSDPTVTGVTLTPSKYGALVNSSSESFEDSSGLLQNLIVEDLLRSTGTQIDTDCLVGPGTANRIKGLKNQTGVTAQAFAGGNGAVPILDDVLSTIVALQAQGSKIEDIAVFLNPAIFGVLQKSKAVGGGTFLFGDPTAASAHSLFGARVYPTANLPQTETVGTSSGVCSTIITADMSRVAIGVGRDVNVQTSNDYLFGSDQVSVRVTGRFDLQLIQASAVVVLPGAKAA